jgi:hypothetical protein
MALRGARLSAIIIVVGMLGASGLCHAQKLRKAGKIAKLAIERTRRGIALGPWIGGVGAIGLDSGDADGAISFGTTLMFFKVPVLPDTETIQEIIKDRVQAQMLARIKQVTLERGKPPSKAEAQNLAKEIAKEVLATFVEERKPKKLEKPRFALNVESARFFRSDAWEFRTTPTWGIGPVFVGPTLLARTEPDAAAYIGPEIHVAVMPGSGPRSPIIDVFLRADFALGGAGTEHIVSAGVRFVLDII